MERTSCDGCRHDLGGGCCRINLEDECGAGGFEAWEDAEVKTDDGSSADELPDEFFEALGALASAMADDCLKRYKLNERRKRRRLRGKRLAIMIAGAAIIVGCAIVGFKRFGWQSVVLILDAAYMGMIMMHYVQSED